MNWLLAADTWKACLWLGITFTVIASLTLIVNLPQEGHGYPWFLTGIMLLNAVIWFARARQLFVRTKKATETARESVDES